MKSKYRSDKVYRVKQQVKARMQFIQDERKKQTFEEVYEFFILDIKYKLGI